MRAALFALVLAGCSNSFDPSYRVVELRLIGVKAEPPEVDPGATSTLTALVVDESHGDAGAALVKWFLCKTLPVPGSGAAVNPDCFSPDAGDLLEPIGEGETVDVTMPMFSAPFPFELGLPDGTGGFYLPILLRVERGEERIDGVYRLRFHLPFQPANSNPRFEPLVVLQPADAGEPIPLDENGPTIVHEGFSYKLRASFTADSEETYVTVEGDPRQMMTRTVTEILSVSWFTTAGSLAESVTGGDKPDNELRLDFEHTPDPPSLVDLYLVGRDERGGTTFLQRRFKLEPE